MKNNSIEDIKNEYGEIILNTSILNLISYGLTSYDGIYLKDCVKTTFEVFENLHKENSKFPITKDFAIKVLNCQFALLELKPMEILTYFANNVKKED